MSLTSVTGMEQKNELVPSAPQSTGLDEMQRVFERDCRKLKWSVLWSQSGFHPVFAGADSAVRLPECVFFFGLALSFFGHNATLNTL